MLSRNFWIARVLKILFTLNWWWEIDFKLGTWLVSWSNKVQAKSSSEFVISISRPRGPKPECWCLCDPNLGRTWDRDRSVPVSRDGAACTENHYDVRRGQESERVGGSPGPGPGQGREVAWAHQSSLPPNIVLLPPDWAELNYFIPDCEIVFRPNSLPHSRCLRYHENVCIPAISWVVSVLADEEYVCSGFAFYLDHRQDSLAVTALGGFKREFVMMSENCIRHLNCIK